MNNLIWEVVPATTGEYNHLRSWKNPASTVIDDETLLDYTICVRAHEIYAQVNRDVLYSYKPYARAEIQDFAKTMPEELEKARRRCEQHFANRGPGKMKFTQVAHGANFFYRAASPTGEIFEAHNEGGRWQALVRQAIQGELRHKHLGRPGQLEQAFELLNSYHENPAALQLQGATTRQDKIMEWMRAVIAGK